MNKIPEEKPSILEPLTKKNKNGVPYQREPGIEEQIISSMVLPDTDIIARAEITDKTNLGYLQEEAIIYMIRKSFQERRSDLYNSLSQVLLNRCHDQLDYRLKSLDLAEDAYADVIQKLFEKILGSNGEGDFLQVRFWSALDRIAIDAFRRYSGRLRKDHTNLTPSYFSGSDETYMPDGDREGSAPAPNSSIPNERWGSSVERDVLVVDALQSLEEPLRTVYVLYYLQDWPIESKDPNKLTLSKYYNKTSKTIRNWLRKAENIIKEWRGDPHE